MVKVKMSLDNYNKFVSFIGKDWVEENYSQYLKDPNKTNHPFIRIHSNIQNATKYDRKFIPKEIYYNMLLKNYQKFNFIGSFIELLDAILPNPARFKNDLRNPTQFEDTLFEVISFGILINTGFKFEKVKEEEGKLSPDFLIKNEESQFSVECTRSNIPGDVKKQEESSSKFFEDLEEYLDEIKSNCQIHLTTSSSLNDEYNELLQLTKEVIDRRATDIYRFNDNGIIIYHTLSKFQIGEEHELQEFLQSCPAVSIVPSNLGSRLLYETNLKKVMNVREISLNYEINI